MIINWSKRSQKEPPVVQAQLGGCFETARRAHDATMTTMRDQQNGKTNKAIPLILENEGRYEVSDEATKLLDDLSATTPRWRRRRGARAGRLTI